VSSSILAGFPTRAFGQTSRVQRALSLTLDDGPDPTWTPLVLDELQRCGAEATFFMVGERVLRHPDIARQVLAGGHDVQLHCHRHIRHTKLTETELEHDTATALEALEAVGAWPRLWRTPWGISTDASRQVAGRLGLQLVRWSIDTHDWRGDPPQRMLAQARRRLADGGAVLMHDALGPGATRAGCENTLALLPVLTAAARTHGLALTPMRPLATQESGVPA
jgi:peptidoglycan-N-acetylglucosamine deacetylase